MHRSLRVTVFSALAAIPAVGLFIGIGTANASTHAPASASAAIAPSAVKEAHAKAAAIAAIKKLRVGSHAQNHPAAGNAHANISALTQEQSTNWAGYADTGSGFTKVTGRWIEPTPTCSSSTTSLAAFWVGIDGFNSNSVEQDGTLIECYGGGTYQFTWWEMYPTNAIQVVGSSVGAGDSITATVTRSGTSYALTVTDSTRPTNSFSTTQSCTNCANSSVEWIAEAPSGSSGVYPLAKFSLWTLTSASWMAGSASGTIPALPDYEITMVNNLGQVKAQPGPLNSAGNSFTVTWVRAS